MVKKTNFTAKISELEGKIHSIKGLATSVALTAVENKILDVSSLVKKTDFNTKVTKVGGKVPDFSSFDYATEITSIKNDYVTNAALNARHRDLIKKQNLILK